MLIGKFYCAGMVVGCGVSDTILKFCAIRYGVVICKARAVKQAFLSGGFED